jgi:hypothetical protein
MTPPLLNGSMEVLTVTPQTCPSGWITAYPPKPDVIGGIAGVGRTTGRTVVEVSSAVCVSITTVDESTLGPEVAERHVFVQ